MKGPNRHEYCSTGKEKEQALFTPYFAAQPVQDIKHNHYITIREKTQCFAAFLCAADSA